MEDMDTDQSSCLFDNSMPERPVPVGRDVTIHALTSKPIKKDVTMKIPRSPSRNRDEPIQFPEVENIEPVYFKAPSTRSSSPSPLVLEDRFAEMQITGTHYVTRSVTRRYEVMHTEEVSPCRLTQRKRGSIPDAATKGRIQQLKHRETVRGAVAREEIPHLRLPMQSQAARGRPRGRILSPQQIRASSTPSNTFKRFVHSTPKIPKSRMVSQMVSRAKGEARAPSPKMGVSRVRRMLAEPRITRSKSRLLRMTPAEAVQERRSRKAAESLSMLTFPSTPKSERAKSHSKDVLSCSPQRIVQGNSDLLRPTDIDPSRPALLKTCSSENQKPLKNMSNVSHQTLAAARRPVKPNVSADYVYYPPTRSANAMILSSTRLSAVGRSSKTTSQKVTRTSSFINRMRNLASNIKKTFTKKSKSKQPEQKSIDVTNYSNIQEASDVQWVELSSKQTANSQHLRCVGTTDEVLNTSIPINCFGRGKLTITKKRQTPRAQCLMKERKATPYKRPDIVVKAKSSSTEIGTPLKPKSLKALPPINQPGVSEPELKLAAEKKLMAVEKQDALGKISPMITTPVKPRSIAELPHESHSGTTLAAAQKPPVTMEDDTPLETSNACKLVPASAAMPPASICTDVVSMTMQAALPSVSSKQSRKSAIQIPVNETKVVVPRLPNLQLIRGSRKSKRDHTSKPSSMSSLPASASQHSNAPAMKPIPAKRSVQKETGPVLSRPPAQHSARNQSTASAYHTLLAPKPFPTPSIQQQPNPVTMMVPSMQSTALYQQTVGDSRSVFSVSSFYESLPAPVLSTQQPPLLMPVAPPQVLSRQSSMPALHFSGNQTDLAHRQAVYNQQLLQFQSQQYQMLCIQNSDEMYLMNHGQQHFDRRPAMYNSHDPVLTQTCFQDNHLLQPPVGVPQLPYAPFHPPPNDPTSSSVCTLPYGPKLPPARRPSSLTLKSREPPNNLETQYQHPMERESTSSSYPLVSSPIVQERTSSERPSCMFANVPERSASIPPVPMHMSVAPHATGPVKTEFPPSQQQSAALPSLPISQPSCLLTEDPSSVKELRTQHSDNIGQRTLLPTETGLIVLPAEEMVEDLKNQPQQTQEPQSLSTGQVQILSLPATASVSEERGHVPAEPFRSECRQTDGSMVNLLPTPATTNITPAQENTPQQEATPAILITNATTQESMPDPAPVQETLTLPVIELSVSSAADATVVNSRMNHTSCQNSTIPVSCTTTSSTILTTSVLSHTGSWSGDTMILDLPHQTSLGSISSLPTTDLSEFNLTLFDVLDHALSSPENSKAQSMMGASQSSSPSSSMTVLNTPVPQKNTPVPRESAVVETKLSFQEPSCDLLMINTTTSGQDNTIPPDYMLTTLPDDCNKHNVVQDFPGFAPVQKPKSVTVLPIVEEWSKTIAYQGSDTESAKQLIIPSIRSGKELLRLDSFNAHTIRESPEEETDPDCSGAMSDNDDDDVFSSSPDESRVLPKSRKRLFAEVEKACTTSTSCIIDDSATAAPVMAECSSPEAKRAKVTPKSSDGSQPPAVNNATIETSIVDAKSSAPQMTELISTTVVNETQGQPQTQESATVLQSPPCAVSSTTTSCPLKHTGLRPAFTENCRMCSYVSKLLDIRPFDIEGQVGSFHLLKMLEDPHYFKFDSAVSEDLKIPRHIEDLAFRSARGKPHIFARNLTFLLFTIGDLYKNRVTSLEKRRTKAIELSVLSRFHIELAYYESKCETFINQCIRTLFHKKLKGGVYKEILEHTC